MRKYSKMKNENNIINDKVETWRDVFISQVDDGKYWQNLFKDEFNRHLFLDRSDAVYICRKAQSDVYDVLIKKLKAELVQLLENDNTIENDYDEVLSGLSDSDCHSIGQNDGEIIQTKNMIKELEDLQKKMWEEDISALGM